MVALSDVLIWPIDCEHNSKEKGEEATSEGAMLIPFSVMHYLRAQFGIDVALRSFSFSTRGLRFWKEVVMREASHARQREMA